MTFDGGKVILRDEAFQDAETTGVLAQGPDKVSVTTQPVAIQIERLLTAAGEQSLLDQQLVLIQNSWIARRCLRFRFQAGSKLGAHGLVDGLWLRPQKIAEELAEEGVSRVHSLPISFVTEHQPERLEPLQMFHQLVIRKADESPGYLSTGLHDPAEKFYFDSTRKQRQAGEKVALYGG